MPGLISLSQVLLVSLSTLGLRTKIYDVEDTREQEISPPKRQHHRPQKQAQWVAVNQDRNGAYLIRTVEFPCELRKKVENKIEVLTQITRKKVMKQ